MTGRWSLYRALRTAFHASGMPTDQAIEAARIADRVSRERRDYCIRMLHASGMSMRRIAQIWGIDPALVHRICRQPLTDAMDCQRPRDAA